MKSSIDGKLEAACMHEQNDANRDQAMAGTALRPRPEPSELMGLFGERSQDHAVAALSSLSKG